MTLHPELAQRWVDEGKLSTRAFYEVVRGDYPNLTWPKTVHALRSELGMGIREARKSVPAPTSEVIPFPARRKTLEDLELEGRKRWEQERTRLAGLGRWLREFETRSHLDP